jgi:phage gp16-like protein
MSASEIDLKEAARLVAELERDLQKLRAGSADLQTVRAEVEALRSVLHSTGGEDRGLRAALHAVRQALERALETVEGEAIRDWPYIAEIGRMLGMR